MTTTVRNIAIVAMIAAGVAFIPGGGPGARTAIQAISLMFLATAGWFASIQYRERKSSLYGLGDRRRAVLYGALAVGALTLTARSRLWGSTVGEFVWLALVAGCVYALVALYLSARQY
jgi:hypothetical protein